MSRSTSLTEERCQALVAYLQGSNMGSHEYPLDFWSNDKRELRQQAASFEVDQGVLYHKVAMWYYSTTTSSQNYGGKEQNYACMP